MGKEFPRFPAEYRQRWIDKGLWADLRLHDIFDETADSKLDDTALVTKSHRITFREFKDDSKALAAGLLDRGVGLGDIVTVQLPNWPEMCLLQVALSRIGAVIHPMHLVYRQREMEELLTFCESDVVIAPDSFGDFAFADAVRDIRSSVDSVRLLIVARGEAKGDSEATLDGLIEAGRTNLDLLDGAGPGPDDVYYLNFTSGTEGQPKGFLHTHNTLFSLMRLAGFFMAQTNPDTVRLCCSPMTHSAGHYQTYFVATAGFPMVLVARYRPLEVLELIEREKVTDLWGTPAHLFGILDHPDFEKYDTSTIRSVGSGAARVPPELVERIERTWGIKTTNAYGLSETNAFTVTSVDDPPEKLKTTVGRVNPTAEARVVDPADRTKEMPPGEVGEIAFRGPALFVGYYKLPELTASTRDEEGWFYTGDLGYFDEDSYLCFAARQKEVINRGGSKIYPKEIDNLLIRHPKVQQVAVVGYPDLRMGERVGAYVVPIPGEEVTLDELAEFLKAERVMKYKIPEALFLVEELPLTPTGKIHLVALQEDAAKRAAASA